MMFLRFSLLLIFLLLNIGCAAQSRVQTEADFKIRNYKTVNVNVISAMPVCEKDCQEDIKNIEKLLIEKFRQTTLFENVNTQIENAELTINVKINELLRVTSKDRFLWGSLAGRAKVAGTVELFDNQKGGSVGKFFVEGVSSGGTAFAGTTEQAIEKFVEQIINFMYEKVTI